MTLGSKHDLLSWAAGAAFLATVSSAAFAQDAGGLNANATLSQGLIFSDETGTSGLTNLGFGISSTTSVQTLQLDVEAAFEQGGGDSISSGGADQGARLSYGLESRQTALTADISYRQSDADSFVSTLDSPGVLVLDDGTREEIASNVGLEFGREARFGATVDVGYSELNFNDTTSSELVDLQTTTAGLGFRFEIDPRVTATLDYQFSDTDRVAGRDTNRQRIFAGTELAVTPTLTADLSLGFTRVATTDAGLETIEDGLSYEIGLIQSRPLGTVRFSFGSDVFETGRRTTAVVGRTLETRRGDLAVDVGLSQSDGSDTVRPLFALSYNENLARGSYSVSVSQRFESTTAGDEALSSSVSLDWEQDLTRTSRVSSDLTYEMTDVFGFDDDRSRLELGLNFSRDLTPDWALRTRYTHSLVREDGSASAQENEIFLGVETSFGWRP